MLMVFFQFESIWVSLATRSGQGHLKNVKFNMFNFKTNPVYDAECPQESNGAICYSVRGLEPQKSRLIVWRHH